MPRANWPRTKTQEELNRLNPRERDAYEHGYREMSVKQREQLDLQLEVDELQEEQRRQRHATPVHRDPFVVALSEEVEALRADVETLRKEKGEAK